VGLDLKGFAGLVVDAQHLLVGGILLALHSFHHILWIAINNDLEGITQKEKKHSFPTLALAQKYLCQEIENLIE